MVEKVTLLIKKNIRLECRFSAREINKNARSKSHLISIKNKMEEVSNKGLTKLIKDSEIPKPQSILLQEIFATAKYTNSKSRHYSDSWMIICILFQIRLDKMSKKYTYYLKYFIDLPQVINFCKIKVYYHYHVLKL